MSPYPSESPDRSGRQGQSDAFGAFGLMVSGVLVWGGAGWLVSAWLDNRIFIMLGLLLGMGASLYLIWFRYSKP